MYGTSYFQRNESGHYSCFFVGCGKKLQANFSRHVAKHEQDGDAVDPNLAQHMKSTSPAGPPMQTCSHPFHMAWWHTPPEQPIGEFYNRSYKCKRCYIKQQMDRKKLRVATEKMENKGDLKASADSIVSISISIPIPISRKNIIFIDLLYTSPSTPTPQPHDSIPLYPPDNEEQQNAAAAVAAAASAATAATAVTIVTSTAVAPTSMDVDPNLHVSISKAVPSLSLSSSTSIAPSSASNTPRSSSPPPKRKKVNHNPKDDLILPEGWTTHTTTRKNGKSAGRVVPHWISPEGKKFRSKAAIKEFLAKNAPPPLHSLDPSNSLLPASSSPSDHMSHHLSHHTHHQSNHHSFPPPLPSSLSGGELPSSVLTPLGEDDKIFGMNVMHHQRDFFKTENLGFKPILPLDDDDDPLLNSQSTNSPLSEFHLSPQSNLYKGGFVNTSFSGVLPQLQAVGFCRVSGHLDGLGLMTQITIGEKTFRGFVLNEDFSSLSPSSSPSSSFPSSLENYTEIEKHIQACQDIFFDDAAMRNKVMGIDMSVMMNNSNTNNINININNNKSHMHNMHNPLPPLHNPPANTNTSMLHSTAPSNLHPSSMHTSLHPSLHSSLNGHRDSFNDLELDDEDEDERHMNSLNLSHHHHISHHHLSSHHILSSHHPPPHLTRRDGGSNSSTDTEEGLGGYDLKSESLSSLSSGYDGFSNPSTHDPDSFLNTKHHPDLNPSSSLSSLTSPSDALDGLDIIADDMPPEIDITTNNKHTQDAPMHKSSHMGGLLNTHMLISPRHLMNV